jgi:hypothetical protein
MEKAKIFYFTVFIFIVFAFIFHINAMGHHHWKKATPLSTATPTLTLNYTTIGLFTRCIPSQTYKEETCFPNLYPANTSCDWTNCLQASSSGNCQCDFSPSTKGIAACTILAAIFLGLAIIILFVHSINTNEPRSLGLFLGFCPLILLLLAFIFILIALILVGSYLSRDIMLTLRNSTGMYILKYYKKKS